MMNRISPYLLLILLGIFASCSDEETNNTPSGLIYSYYPTNVGHEVIYDVSLITKDDFSGAEDTAIYQIKEVIESIFQDNQGRPTQRLERYRRETPNDPWIISDVWTANMTTSRVEKVEENIPYVKLVFPINSSVTWNGNSLNTLDPQDYEYDNLHQSDLISGISFDSTITVLQLDFIDIFKTLYQAEKYATGVGRIYKEDIEINKTPAGAIKSQRLYIETIVSWSN
jgi:hypothetical protein